MGGGKWDEEQGDRAHRERGRQEDREEDRKAEGRTRGGKEEGSAMAITAQRQGGVPPRRCMDRQVGGPEPGDLAAR